MNIAYSLAVQREGKVPALLQWSARHFGPNVSTRLSHPDKKNKINKSKSTEKLSEKLLKSSLEIVENFFNIKIVILPNIKRTARSTNWLL